MRRQWIRTLAAVRVLSRYLPCKEVRLIGSCRLVPRVRLGWGAAVWFCTGLLVSNVALAVDKGEILLSFPPNTPLKAVIAYVSDRSGLNIIYDEPQVNQQVTLKTPVPIPESALLDLLESVLRTKGLTLEDTGILRVKRIVPVQQTTSSGVTPGGAMAEGVPGVVTQVFSLQHIQADAASLAVQPLFSKQGGSVIALPDQNLLIATDLATNLQRIGQAIELIDVPGDTPAVALVTIRYGYAPDILQAIQPMLQGQTQGGRPAAAVAAASDIRSNQLILVGRQDRLQQVEEVIRSLDVPSEMIQEVYRLEYVPADRLDELIRSLLDEVTAQHSYRSVPVGDSGLLSVTAPRHLHEQIEAFLENLRRAMPQHDPNPVQFYKLTNTKAADVLATIRSLEGKGTTLSPQIDPFQSSGGDTPRAPLVPLYDEPTDIVSPSPPLVQDGSVTTADPLISPLLGEALVSADPHTNSIIVIGTPAEQAVYGALIQHLDQRRPQVLIETTIVALDTTDDFTLGVDIGTRGGFHNNGQIISFSSFGVSMLDPKTGSLSPIDAPGGTLAVLDPDVADIVIRALATETRSRLVSMPRILVNDNEEGTLESLSEEPYIQTIVTETSTTTSAGGPARAGTRIKVTPSISNGNYIQLEYELELSSFTAVAQPNLPPPTQTNTIASRVTIPDRHTIIVGGLNRKTFDDTKNKVPVLGDIPLLGNIFKSNSKLSNNQTLFVFIRPMILRDETFADLKELSSRELTPAGLPWEHSDTSQTPESPPREAVEGR